MSIKWILAGLATIGIVVVLADLVVTTEEERVDAVLEEGKRAVEAGDFTGVERLISSNYACDGRDRKTLLQKAEWVLGQYSPMRVLLFSEEIEFSSESSALVRLSAVISPRGKSRLPQTTRSSWEVRLEKEEEGWMVVGIRPIL